MSEQETQEVETLNFEMRPASASDLEFCKPVGAPRGTSKYDQLVQAAAQLTPGAALVLSPEEGEDLHKLRNRVTGPIRNKAQELNPHGRLRIRLTQKGQVAVVCEEFQPEGEETDEAGTTEG